MGNREVDGHIIMGFYLGLGDFVSAVPVMRHLLQQGHSLTVIASQPNLELATLMDLPRDRIRWLAFEPFAWRRLGAAMRFYFGLARLSPDLVVVSPHAPAKMASWKLPLLLKALKVLHWHQAKLVGGRGERLSSLFDQVLPIDRELPLAKREWQLHQLLGTVDPSLEPCLRVFDDNQLDRTVPAFDLIVHPGASRPNKQWPIENYGLLLDQLSKDLTVCFLGLPHELDPLRSLIGHRHRVTYHCGSLGSAVSLMSRAGMVLTMDSGFSHLASSLGVSHLSLFGSTNPDLYRPSSTNSQVMYQPGLPCQPCDSRDCHVPGIPCMSRLSPNQVADSIRQTLGCGVPT